MLQTYVQVHAFRFAIPNFRAHWQNNYSPITILQTLVKLWGMAAVRVYMYVRFIALKYLSDLHTRIEV